MSGFSFSISVFVLRVQRFRFVIEPFSAAAIYRYSDIYRDMKVYRDMI